MNVTVACTCPPKASGEPRHDHDTVTFRDRLDFHGGMVIRKALTMLKTEDPDSDAADVLAVMTERYMLEGITGWSRVDAKGKAVDCDKSAIRAYIAEHEDIAVDLADVADGLYQEQVLLPLVRRASESSPTSPMEPSTSAPNGSEATTPKRSRRSSTTTTPTDGITPITSLHDGGSSTSQRSA